jgi:hypothetical protein
MLQEGEIAVIVPHKIARPPGGPLIHAEEAMVFWAGQQPVKRGWMLVDGELQRVNLTQMFGDGAWQITDIASSRAVCNGCFGRIPTGTTVHTPTQATMQPYMNGGAPASVMTPWVK